MIWSYGLQQLYEADRRMLGDTGNSNDAVTQAGAHSVVTCTHDAQWGDVRGQTQHRPHSWPDTSTMGRYSFKSGRKEGLNFKTSILCLHLREFSTNVKMGFNWGVFKTLYTHDLSLASCIICVSLVLWSGAALILVSPSIRLSDHLNTKSLLS